MSLLKRLPAPIRYWKARVSFLFQPMIWGSLSLLILLVLFSWEFWVNSLVAEDENTADLRSQVDDFSSQLSNEDSSIGLDLDTMSSLAVDITRGNERIANPGISLANPSGPASKQQNSNSGSNSNPLSQSIPIPGSSLQSAGGPGGSVPSLSPDPFSVLTNLAIPGLTPSPLSGFGPASIPGLGNALTQQGSTSAGDPFYPNPAYGSAPGSVTSATPLQAAMSQYNPIPQTNLSTGQTALPGFTQYSPTPTSPGLGLAPTTSLRSGQSGPSGSPDASTDGFEPDGFPTTNYPGLPAAPALPSSSLRTPAGSPSSFGLPSSAPQQGTGFSGGPDFSSPGGVNTPVAQPAPSAPVPFSVPNSIGNGQINTFSNP